MLGTIQTKEEIVPALKRQNRQKMGRGRERCSDSPKGTQQMIDSQEENPAHPTLSPVACPLDHGMQTTINTTSLDKRCYKNTWYYITDSQKQSNTNVTKQYFSLSFTLQHVAFLPLDFLMKVDRILFHKLIKPPFPIHIFRKLCSKGKDTAGLESSGTQITY